MKLRGFGFCMRLFFYLTGCLLFLALLSGTAYADERLVAVILTRDTPRYQAIHEAFAEKFGQPKGVKLYVQIPNGDILSLRNSARKAVAIGADAILTYGATATRAALAESYETPIFYADVIDPMVQGFIPDHFTPGKHVTGIRGDAPVQTLLKHFQAATGASCLCALYQKDEMSADNQVESLRRIAEKKGWEVLPRAFSRSMDATTIMGLVSGRCQGIYCADSLVLLNQAAELVHKASERKLPVISQIPGMAEEGAFMVLETDPAEQGGHIADYLLRFLHGATLEELPPERPRNVSLVINLKTAKQLDIKVPFEVLSVTSRIIR